MQLKLSVDQIALAGVYLEVGRLKTFTVAVHDRWDEREATLGATGRRAERAQLYEQTEALMTRLIDWTSGLRAATARSDDTADDAAAGPIQAAIDDLDSAARAMLEGLRLPKSAEDEPGRTRREGFGSFVSTADAITSLALADLPTMTNHEWQYLELRLLVGALAEEADRINDTWDSRRATYARTEWELGNLIASVDEVVSRTDEALPTSEEQRANVERACDDLETFAEAILSGLQLPRSAEVNVGAARHDALASFGEAATAFDRAASAAMGIPEDSWVASPAIPGMTPHDLDIEPPMVTIESPQSGTVTANEAVTVKGTVEPGAFVQVDDAPAPVSESGGWQVHVDLAPGINTITIAATDRAGNVSGAELEIRFGYELGRNRIGPSRLGDVDDGVISAFTDLFGVPHSDVIVDDPWTWGIWAEQARIVWWENDGITLVFTASTTGGVMKLFSWYTTNPLFFTTEGIHVGATLGDLQEAYPGRVSVGQPNDCGAGDFYVASATQATNGALWGHVTGPPYNSSSVITYFAGGTPSDTC